MDASRAYARLRRLEHRARGAVLGGVIRAAGGRVGRAFTVEAGVTLRRWPHRGIQLGNDVHLGRGVILDVPKGGRLILDDGVKIMHYTVVAAAQSIRIGSLSQVAESCSVRDSDHGVATDQPIFHQLVSTPTVIGADVWIGRGCAVLRGATMGDGAVLGANSVLKGAVPPGGIAVGSPARVVRMRDGGLPPEPKGAA